VEPEGLEVVIFERQGPVAIVRMNRPERLNALNFQIHRDLIACYQTINDDPEIRAAILTGTGRYFSAGRDIKEYIGTYDSGTTDHLRPLDDPDHELFAMTCASFPVRKPLIGAVNGHVFGGGLSTLVLTDMIVMSSEATITDGHARVNIGGLACLVRYLPVNIAREMTMGDRTLTAAECLQWGFANYVVSPDEVMPKALEVAERISKMGPDTVAHAKRMTLEIQAQLGQLLSAEERERRRADARTRLAERVGDHDLMEGMRAFVTGREAIYERPVS
jgi:enoyl-CoA hydratase/carnithine racemase